MKEKGKYLMIYNIYDFKLDGVGPVDNRPSTDYLHNFVKKKKNDT